MSNTNFNTPLTSELQKVRLTSYICYASYCYTAVTLEILLSKNFKQRKGDCQYDSMQSESLHLTDI